jgi:MFS family permease
MFPGKHVRTLPDFRALWTGQFISQTGDAVYFLVLVYAANYFGGSTAPFVVMLFGSLPFLLSPFAGLLADRVDRRKILLYSEIASAAVLAPLFVTTLFVDPEVWWLSATAFALSTVNTLFTPARNACIPRLVPREMLAEANGLIAATQWLTYASGIIFAAVVLSSLEALVPQAFFPATVAFNMLTFSASAFYMNKLPAIRPIRSDEEEATRARDVLQGLVRVRENAVLRIAFPLTILINLAISGFMPIYVIVNERWFGGALRTFVLLELSFALTMVVSNAMVERLKWSRPGPLYGIGFGITGLSVALMALQPSFMGFVLLNILAGLALPFAWVPMAVYIQSAVPDRDLGRVNGVFGLAGQGIAPVGIMLAERLVAVLGLAGMFAVMGLGMAVPSFGALGNKGFRETRRKEGEPTPPESSSAADA